jgi:hypothetical protein
MLARIPYCGETGTARQGVYCVNAVNAVVTLGSIVGCASCISEAYLAGGAGGDPALVSNLGFPQRRFRTFRTHQLAVAKLLEWLEWLLIGFTKSRANQPTTLRTATW